MLIDSNKSRFNLVQRQSPNVKNDQGMSREMEIDEDFEEVRPRLKSVKSKF